MALFFQQFLNGLTLGGVYSLVALGLTLVYGILHVPNFAHGALYMAGAYVSYYAMTTLGLNYWLAPTIVARAGFEWRDYTVPGVRNETLIQFQLGYGF